MFGGTEGLAFCRRGFGRKHLELLGIQSREYLDMLMALRGASFDATVVYDHLWRLDLPQNGPCGCQIAQIQIVRLRYEQGRMQDQHWSIHTIFVQDQLVRLPDSCDDPLIRRIDKGTNGFGTTGIIGREYWLLAQCWCYVKLKLQRIWV